jgi:AcrR family transcriptional regulator
MSDEPELSRVERRRMDARRRILDAAQQLFLVEASYDKATISDIARCADVSVGAVYLLFKNKYAILTELIDEYFSRMVSELSTAKESERTGYDQLVKVATESGRWYYDNIILMQFLPQMDSDEFLKNRLTVHVDEIIDMFLKIMEKGKEDRSIRTADDPLISAIVFYHGFNGILSLDSDNANVGRHLSGGYSLSAKIDEYLRLFAYR